MPALYCGLFLVAGSVLVLEIALTRVLAIMMWHHFTYLVVSIALLGFGAAGSALTAMRFGLRQDSPAGPLTVLSILYGFVTMATIWLVVRVPVDTMALWSHPENLFWLGLLYALLTVPFVLAGAVVGLALSRFAENVNRLYFADLVGSAIGGAASIWLLTVFGSMGTVMVAGALGVAGGAAFSLTGSQRLRVGAFAATLLAVLTCAGLTRNAGEPGHPLAVPFAPGKELAFLDPTRLFGPTAEVEIGPDIESLPFLGGDLGAQDARSAMARTVGQDGSAPTLLFKGAASIESFPFLNDTQAGTAYVAHAARGATGPEVLVIGVGGGIDIMIALAHEASKVTAAEINPAMVEMVQERYDDYLDGLFTRSEAARSGRIELLVEEGRSFVRGTDRRFDIIQMSGVDSFTALSTGAYTLSESYLYTTQAVQDFYTHLADGGYINYSRFVLNHPRKPRETLRLANIARQALEELGVEDPASHILVFQGNQWASTMIKRGPFTEPEVQALRDFAVRQEFWGLAFDPLHDPQENLLLNPRQGFFLRRTIDFVLDQEDAGLVRELPREPTARLVEAAYAERIGATANDVDLEAVWRTTLAGLPPDRHDTVREEIEQAASRTVFIAERKVGDFQRKRKDFQRLLRGGAAEREDFVAGYEYDITPATDNAPFFFNYYRYADLWGGIGEADQSRGAWDKYHPDFPVGHLVLLVSMVQTVLLGALLILLPLRSLERAGVAASGRGSVFLYFAALGAGFMLIEIVLMQKMVLFLGHPTYSVTVVLSALLAFAGIGSFLADRIRELTPRVLALLLLAILVVLGGVTAAVTFVLPGFLHWPFAARATSAVAVLAPLGIVLGMAFPSGIRIVQRYSPALVPWAWAINGFLSVFGSVACILLSMVLGFSNVLFVAGLLYAVGFGALFTRLRLWAAPDSAPAPSAR